MKTGVSYAVLGSCCKRHTGMELTFWPFALTVQNRRIQESTRFQLFQESLQRIEKSLEVCWTAFATSHLIAQA